MTVNLSEALNAYQQALKRPVEGGAGADDGLAPQAGSGSDFAAMLREKPGNYIFIGNKGSDGNGAMMLHNPAYDFNDEAIPLGVEYWVKLVERELPKA